MPDSSSTTKIAPSWGVARVSTGGGARTPRGHPRPALNAEHGPLSEGTHVDLPPWLSTTLDTATGRPVPSLGLGGEKRSKIALQVVEYQGLYQQWSLQHHSIVAVE